MFNVEPIDTRNNKCKLNKGFSLLEVLISMLILAIIIAPILGNIVQATRMNKASRNIQDASNLGQNMMESLKTQASFEEVAKQLIYKDKGVTFDLFNLDGISTGQVDYDAASDTYLPAADPCIIRTTDPSTGNFSYSLKENNSRKYEFQVSNILFNGTSYCAKIKYDASVYSKEDPSDVVDKYNDVDMPILPSVSDEKNAVVALNYQDDWAASTLKQLYNVYFNSNFNGDNTVTNDDIAKDMERSLYLDFDYNATKGKYIVKGSFTYRLTSLIPDDSYTNEYNGVLYQQEFDKIENVYLFFSPNLELKRDEITINNNLTGNAADLKVYLVEQLSDLVAKGTYENLMNQYWLTVNLHEAEDPLDLMSNQYIYHTKIRTNLGSTIAGFDGMTRIKYPGKIPEKLDQAQLIDRDKDKTRIYSISLDLYRQSKDGTAMFKKKDFIISFTSSKGE